MHKQARIMTFYARIVLSLILFWMVCHHVNGQSTDTTFTKIAWRKYTTLNVDGKEVKVLTFYTAMHLKENDFLPLLSISMYDVHFATVEIKDPEWQELTSDDMSYLPNPQSIGSSPDINIKNDWANRTPHAMCSFVPLRKNPASGKIEKLLKFRFGFSEETPVFPMEKPRTNTNGQFRLEASSSVLAQGTWHKLGFPSSGIYKIDYGFLLQMGINPDSININEIQIWGNGGGMLPEPCAAPRPVDLTQTPIYVSGAEDGRFNLQDYILFYVQGPNIWQKDDSDPFYTPLNNFYSSYSYYFFTIGNANGSRIQTVSNSSTPETIFTTYNNRYVHEKETSNLLASGRMWFGEEFSDVLSQTFPVPTTGVAIGSTIYLQSSLMNQSNDSFNSSFTVSVNGKSFGKHSLPGSGTGNDIRIGEVRNFLDTNNADYLATTNTLLINYTYTKSIHQIGTGYLDYFAVNFEENLTQKSNPIDFRQLKSINYNVVQYNIAKSSGNAALRVWDITDLGNIYEPIVTNSSSISSFVDAPNGVIHQYLAFSGSNFPYPSSNVLIANQNVAASPTPDLVIVTHPGFRSQAERLAAFKKQNDGLDVVVATTEEVYNEFSSGSQDLVAIRDFARNFYTRSDGGKFKYLLLLGDASYDYKNLLNYSQATSFVPIYESVESLDPLASYSSDDYVGMLGINKGDWQPNYSFDLDIGVGRLPVKSQAEAEGVLAKIIHYASNTATLSEWKQTISYVADNIEVPQEDAFFNNAESLASYVESTAPAYNVKKIYVGAYQKEATPSGNTAPGANIDITATINTNGCFIMDYIGHGGISQWALENVLNIPMIQSYTNLDKLTFFVTATCNFGQYDNPAIVSGGELFLLESQGGAIGLLTTTRAVYQTFNEYLNDAFHRNVFKKVNGQHLRLGDIQMNTKNDRNVHGSVYTRNFALLGDPSLMLAYPKDTIVLTSFNNSPYVSGTDTMKAREKVTITGEIRDGSGQVAQNFNGVVNIFIFDKKTTTETVDIVADSKVPPQYQEQFQVLENKIFNGSATVKNGEFSFTLIIPRNINYNVGLGKISLYAHTEDGKMMDAGCGETGIYVGSSDTSTIIDNTPPVIKLYMNDQSFIDGGYTNDHPLFIAKLYDDQGISGIGSTGRSITSTLNNDSKSDVVLDSYYKTDRDTYKSGTINYPMSNLREGNNTIRLKAFDTDTNSATAYLDFVVTATKSISLQHILNYPNPFTTNTAFHFDHNRPGDDLDVMIQVFTVSGKLVKTLTSHAISAHTHFSDLHWDGKDDYGDEIGRGVYVYKVSVKAMSDGSKVEQYEKLVILN
jgi:hypothetical protein